MVGFNIIEYLPAIIGGSMIAFSSSINLLFKGRITGISGILFNLIKFNEFYWRFTFVLSMIWITSLIKLFFSEKYDLFENPIKNTGGLSLLGFIFSGFLVGFGTKLSNGCTSGHGVCGLPRLSIRSFISVLLFCFCGIFTATLNNNFKFTEKIMGDSKIFESIFNSLNINLDFFSNQIQIYIFYSTTFLLLIVFIMRKITKIMAFEFEISFLSGSLFGAGLIISGMNRRAKVLGFLTFNENFDPSLMFVLCSAVGLNLILFSWIIHVIKKPILAEKFSLPIKKEIDLQLIMGSILFGIGWGISGICPGPAIVSVTLYFPEVAFFLVSFYIGQFNGYLIEQFSLTKNKIN